MDRNANVGASAQYTYSPLPIVTEESPQIASDAQLARSLFDREAAALRERDAVNSANRAAARALDADVGAYYHTGPYPSAYYYGTWSPHRHSPQVVYRDPDDYFLCFFFVFLILILIFIVVIVVIYAVTYSDDETDDTSRRRLAEALSPIMWKSWEILFDKFKDN